MVKKLIHAVVVLTFVASTMPTVAHAFEPYPDAKKTERHDCRHAGTGARAAKAEKADKNGPNREACCEKNCACVGGLCGSGSPSLLGVAGLNLDTPSKNTTYFGLAENLAAADRDGRLKRPPRA